MADDWIERKAEELLENSRRLMRALDIYSEEFGWSGENGTQETTRSLYESFRELGMSERAAAAAAQGRMLDVQELGTPSPGDGTAVTLDLGPASSLVKAFEELGMSESAARRAAR